VLKLVATRTGSCGPVPVK